MPFNLSTGVYTPPNGATNALPGQLIQSAIWDAIFTDISAALTQLGHLALAPVETIVTLTPGTIATSDRNVYFNVATAAVTTLPDAATWKTANPGGVLFLKDISGAAATNNITINRAGANTIDGLTSFQIAVNYGWFYLRVSPSNNWMFVG